MLIVCQIELAEYSFQSKNKVKVNTAVDKFHFAWQVTRYDREAAMLACHMTGHMMPVVTASDRAQNIACLHSHSRCNLQTCG